MLKILFVCTGNTCRSPMAEAIFNKKASDIGLDAEALSAGLCANSSPTSVNATEALGEIGIEHRAISKQIDASLVAEADVVYGITVRHANAVISAFPQFAGKVKSFPKDISDPFGGSLEIYRRCRDEIEKGVDEIIYRIAHNEF